jgi:hypothetical protein
MNMKPSELKYNHETRNPNSYFFTRDTMQFFGDTMSNFRVKDKGTHFELYRKHPVKHGLNSSYYFDKTTFERLNGEPTL